MITHHEKSGYGPEQWQIGPSDEYEKEVLYEGRGASIDALLSAFENIGSRTVRLAALGHSKYHDGEFGWAAGVFDTQQVVYDLLELKQEVDNGNLTEEEALEIETGNLMPDFEWQDVTSWSIADRFDQE
jgi:hypothetical protein